jgi:hypothetical protein
MITEELEEMCRRMEEYQAKLKADPEYQAEQRAIRNRNRFNTMYAGGVMEPFYDEQERQEFYQTYYPQE